MADIEHRFIGALATTVLVGRETELAAIAQAVTPGSGPEFQVLAFVANGGMGKTRLLQQTYTWLGGQPITNDPLNHPPSHEPPIWQHEAVLCLPLMDMADPLLHRQVAFLRQLRERFGLAIVSQKPQLDPTALFAGFDAALEEYQTSRERNEPYPKIQQTIKNLGLTFEQDYRRLTGSYRIVWLIDTVEQLYDIREELAETFDRVDLKEQEIEQTTYYWLFDFIGHRPPNTVFLLSGRPQPPRWISDLQTRPEITPSVQRFDLKPFSDVETGHYFNRLSQQLAQEGYQDLAAYLTAMEQDPERLQVMYRLTNGNPIRLALYIDMVTSASEEPDEFKLDIATISQLPPAELETLREQVDDHLLDYIENGIGHPENTVLRYLLVTRRGLNARRLMALSGDDLATCETTLRYLGRLSFVKTRYSKVFLHDELYVMHSRRLVQRQREPGDEYAVRRRELDRIYQTLIDFCQERVDAANQRIAAIQASYDDGQPIRDDDRNRLRKLRRDRPRYQAEKLHYHLYRDPVSGFYDHYYVLAEQAFMGQDIDLDGYLQSEINVFFFGAAAQSNQRQTGLADADWQFLRLVIEEERTARWIKRITQFGKLKRAQRFARKIQERYAQIVAAAHPEAVAARAQLGPADPGQRLFDREATAYRCFAAILQGNPIGPDALPVTLDELLGTIHALEAALRAKQIAPAARTRWLNTIAQCYLYHGYGQASAGSYRVAQSSYEAAKKIARQTGHEALQAEINNDYSRVLGEIGRFHDAIGYCEEGEIVRRKLGFDYAVALSLNTRSLICIRNSRPTPAIKPAKQALSLFRQINNARGIVLAIKQLAEAYRRAWLFDPQAQPIEYLDLAETLLLEALDLVTPHQSQAQAVVQEDVRYIEINMELGSLYRDRLRSAAPDERRRLYTQAMVYLDQALGRASEAELLNYQIDAVLNQAYAAYYAGDAAQAQGFLDAAYELMPDGYRLQAAAPISLEQDTNQALFYLLSKLMNLRAQLDESAHPERLLEWRILGTTYSQLFSHESWYFGEHKAQVQTLIDTETVGNFEQRIAQANAIIDRYHLRALHHKDFGQPEVIRIVDDLSATLRSDDLDYL